QRLEVQTRKPPHLLQLRVQKSQDVQPALGSGQGRTGRDSRAVAALDLDKAQHHLKAGLVPAVQVTNDILLPMQKRGEFGSVSLKIVDEHPILKRNAEVLEHEADDVALVVFPLARQVDKEQVAARGGLEV